MEIKGDALAPEPFLVWSNRGRGAHRQGGESSAIATGRLPSLRLCSTPLKIPVSTTWAPFASTVNMFSRQRYLGW
jgi:hypothetical protein